HAENQRGQREGPQPQRCGIRGDREDAGYSAVPLNARPRGLTSGGLADCPYLHLPPSFRTFAEGDGHPRRAAAATRRVAVTSRIPGTNRGNPARLVAVDLDDHGVALPAAGADRRYAQASAPAPQLVHQG